jgi:hypothetical protein
MGEVRLDERKATGSSLARADNPTIDCNGVVRDGVYYGDTSMRRKIAPNGLVMRGRP